MATSLATDQASGEEIRKDADITVDYWKNPVLGGIEDLVG